MSSTSSSSSSSSDPTDTVGRIFMTPSSVPGPKEVWASIHGFAPYTNGMAPAISEHEYNDVMADLKEHLQNRNALVRRNQAIWVPEGSLAGICWRHEAASALVCRADFWCNRHCKTSPVVLEVFGGPSLAENRPKTGPENSGQTAFRYPAEGPVP